MRDDSADAVLHDYLAAIDAAQAERKLAQLLNDVARPLAQRVVASIYRDWAAAADAEDVVSDTLTDLLRRLRDMRGDPARGIRDLRGYVVTCAYNRCHERLRERYPARNRLRNQLQYLCNHDRRLALWRTAQGGIVCGLREWAGSDAVRDMPRIELAARSDPAAEDRPQIVRLVLAVLRETGGPLDLDLLVGTIARLIGLEQQRVEVPLESIVHNEPRADAVLELRASLRTLWDNVRQLALKQRMALLLNLSEVHLLPLTRTATIAEIAAVLEMPPARFAALWNDLPLSDAAIANLLGATPRQVIKLRRLARERLQRMAKHRSSLELRVSTAI